MMAILCLSMLPVGIAVLVFIVRVVRSVPDSNSDFMFY